MRLCFLCLFASLAGTPPLVGTLSDDDHAFYAERVEAFGAQLAAGGVLAGQRHADGSVTWYLAGDLPGTAEVVAANVSFEIGSITKVFTGLLLAQAMVEERVSLDTTVSALLPHWEFGSEEVAAITVEELATHTSGLPRLPGNLLSANQPDPYAPYTAAMLASFLRVYVPSEPLEKRYAYSNLGTGLLGHALAQGVWKVDFKDALQLKVLEPLGLDNTIIATTGIDATGLAPPHSGAESRAPWTFDVLAAAGALRSTGNDLMRFAEGALAAPDGALGDAFALTFTPRAETEAGARIGLGWHLQELHGRTVWEHGGGTGGFSTWLGVDREARTAVVVLSNNKRAPMPLGIALLGPPEAPAEATAAPALTDAELAAYTGDYPLFDGFILTLTVRDGQLYGQATGQGAFPLTWSDKDLFVNPDIDARVVFDRDDNNKVTGLTLYQMGRAMPAERHPDGIERDYLTLPEEVLEDYVGKYRLSSRMVFTITARDGQLFAQLTDQPAMPVFAREVDRFFYKAVEAELVFARDEKGNVTSLTLYQNGREMPAPRIAE